MKLEKWALVAEILSAVAVVMSLIFVGFQIRQGAEETALNTRAIETSAFQDLTTQINAISSHAIGNPQFAELAARIRRGGKPEKPQEEMQMLSFLFSVYRHGELAFRQYENGLIDEPSLIGMLGPVGTWRNTDTGEEYWRLHTSLNPNYRTYVDAWIEGTGFNLVELRE